MSQALRQPRATAIAVAILFACGWLSTTSCMAGQISSFTTASGEKALVQANKAALQGNARLAAATLLRMPEIHFVGKDMTYRRCMLKRFGPRSAAPERTRTGDVFVGDVLYLYQTYWWHSLMSPPERELHSARLQRDLSSLLGASATIEDWNEIEARVAAELRERGYYALLSVTPPLRELMIWRRQQSSMHEVQLPEGSYSVQVELADDFVARGWNSYARCERSSNAGWATQDRLYVVAPAFARGINNDAFRTSLLGHETQHVADLTRFPNLTSWELEYRAKLTELWLAQESMAWLLGQFHRDQCDDQEIPHLFANQQVMHAMHAQLAAQGMEPWENLLDVPPETLRAAAREVLLRDSREREGVASVAAASAPRD